MPYTVKTRLSPTVVALYTCPVDGVFECEVEREANGDAPEVIPCPLLEPACEEGLRCGKPATWTPSADVACKVKRWEVVRGKWEKPELPTYLDTRKLGEGQPIEEFRAERKKIWNEKRWKEIKSW